MITVLRLGHRIQRDKRITTHVCLVARMFGADEIIIDTKDEHIEDNIRSVVDRFGGTFYIRSGINARRFVKDFPGTIIHLTMYGETLNNAIKEMDRTKDLLILVGAEKVPAEYYELATSALDKVEDIGEAGVKVGLKGAELGIKAATGVFKILLPGYTADDFERDMEKEAEKVERKAEVIEEMADGLEIMLDNLETLHDDLRDEIKELNRTDWF